MSKYHCRSTSDLQGGVPRLKRMDKLPCPFDRQISAISQIVLPLSHRDHRGFLRFEHLLCRVDGIPIDWAHQGCPAPVFSPPMSG